MQMVRIKVGAINTTRLIARAKRALVGWISIKEFRARQDTTYGVQLAHAQVHNSMGIKPIHKF